MDLQEKANRQRRACILACHFSRNLAYFRAARHQHHELLPRHDFWRTANGNFLDVSILEWCKIFGDNHARHSWQKVTTNNGAFMQGLLGYLGASEREFQDYVGNMRRYRDKFLAHLDQLNTMEIPEMEIARKSIMYFYEYLTSTECVPIVNPLPDAIEAYYNFHFDYAQNAMVQLPDSMWG